MFAGKKTLDDMIELQQIVEEKIKEAHQPYGVVKQTSDLDELKKLKDLLDAGAVTQEEFDAKKKQILGL
ncbi:hypothetical protein FD02_GL000741 [Lacticaseibacillus nasuensis JCM 17158]|uniref:SHOCT domain-containing protein n=2 Tax=Lacticaseibacillus TaxID=2759736 RepID=A0A0R1K1V4_9LACO|nr:hypothetical protein FD02_GL000741 [Lacticaseibacillus nasuensis JCM 17158]